MIASFIKLILAVIEGLLWWFSSKEPTSNVRDRGLIPGSGRCPGEENGNLFQYSCLGNPVDRGAWRATVRGVTKESDMTEHESPLNAKS